MRKLLLLLCLAGCGGAPGTETEAAQPLTEVQKRLREHGTEARTRMLPHFEDAGVRYPPDELTFIAIKDEARLEVWGDGRFVRDYRVLAASGESGPKMREGDLQVPEGIYAIDFLNPNSDYHLSMHIDYPNAFDRAHAAEEGRENLGGAIMIHGDEVSVGCLAMGDPAIEELFVLVADVGMPVRILIAPTDLRTTPDADLPTEPAWTVELYQLLREALAPYRR